MGTTTMRENRDPRSVAQGALRRLRMLSAFELAERLGAKESAVAQAEKGGNSAPSRERLRVTAKALEFPKSMADFLVDLLEIGSALPGDPEHPLRPSAEELRHDQEVVLGEGNRHLLEAWEATVRSRYDRRVEEHRAEARRLGKEVLALPSAARKERVDALAATHPGPLWALVERLCDASEKAASDDARRAVHLADLALHAARSASVPLTWREPLIGYAWAFVANARRVASDLPGADSAFGTAWELWQAGKGARLPLGEWRLLDLEASLRRDQQRWEETIRLSKRALASAPKEAKGRILLKQAAGYAQMLNPGLALKTLRRAMPLVLGEGDLHLEWVLFFNLANTLEQLGELEEAEMLLPEVRKRAMALGNELAILRVVWLAARIDGAQERRAEAAAALAQVGRGFAAREIAYDTALAGLEEGVLRLELGETERAGKLALDLHWIFRAQQVKPAALAALRLYCRSAEQGLLTLELAQQALAEFRRAGLSADQASKD